MKHWKSSLNTLKALGLILTMALGLSACAVMPAMGADSWKEEVLLHDGQKIVVERSQTYGGRHEVGQAPPVRELTIAFTLPGSGKRITWTSEYGAELGRTNFKLAALHVLNEMPYLVALPNLCLSYNKWGRPNPPYVVFKYEGNAWKRIPLQEFPAELKDVNMVVNNAGETSILLARPLITADMVKELNGQLTQPEYKTILREPLANYDPECIEMVSNGKGLWRAAAWFSKRSNLAACEAGCRDEKFDDTHCPCKKLFERK